MQRAKSLAQVVIVTAACLYVKDKFCVALCTGVPLSVTTAVERKLAGRGGRAGDRSRAGIDRQAVVTGRGERVLVRRRSSGDVRGDAL